MNNKHMRRAILEYAKQNSGGITTSRLCADFDILTSTAASHLRKLRDEKMLAEIGASGPNGQKRNVITKSGLAYLDSTQKPKAIWDDRALRKCLGMR